MKRGSRSARAALLGFLLVAGTFLFGACGGGGGAGGSDETVNFGTVDWPEAIAKTNVASTIVDALGYQTKVQELGVPTVFQAWTLEISTSLSRPGSQPCKPTT